MTLFATTIGLSAFLLFLVQPLIARQILPWFGGSAAVWTTCMVFFQLVLLAGYFYADWVTRRLSARRQAQVHGALLLLSLALLPIVPSEAFKPEDPGQPVLRILLLLAATIGLPYLMLSTTGPLVQAWFARRFAGTPAVASVWRLYALSNAASMAALLLYPPLIEPAASGRVQALGWSGAYAVFAALAAACGFVAARAVPQPQRVDTASAPATPSEAVAAAAPAGPGRQLLWLVLAALGSVLLLATTNHVTQNVASVPFLWVLPLALYLLSFILTFEGRGWYPRRLGPLLACVAALLMLGALVWRPQWDWTSDQPLSAMFEKGLVPLRHAVPLYATGLFVLCLFAHGELVARKPPPQQLTRFYLMVSLGGALGGTLVGLVAPQVFKAYWEMPAALLAVPLLVLALGRGAQRVVAVLTLAAGGWMAWVHVATVHDTAVEMSRNFYGTLSVKSTPSGDKPDVIRRLLHGVIEHGHQLRHPTLRGKPTSYYGPGSGVAQAIELLREGHPGQPQRVGLIGLGVGTLAAYGRAGDTYRFYELNPAVLDLALRHFSFLADSPAHIEHALGDARLVLEREAPQRFELLAVDAFSSDSIPVHLITREALAVYRRHLVAGGVVAFHVSNRYLDLAPVVAGVAATQGLQAWRVSDVPEDDATLYESDWVLVTADAALLERLRARGKAERVEPPARAAWSDDHHNLFEVLRN